MILAIIQARCSSSRLPNKVLKNILGKPMLLRMYERVSRSQLIDKIVIATSTESSDDLIEQLCKDNNIDCYRGDLQDVLSRFYQCSKSYNPDCTNQNDFWIVRLTGDCAITCSKEIDRIIESGKLLNFDYFNNGDSEKGIIPDGLDVEMFKFSALERAWKESKDREHVTTYIRNNPYLFTSIPLPMENEIFYDMKLSVDTQEDFERVSKIFEALYPANHNFGLQDIINYLEANPHEFK